MHKSQGHSLFLYCIALACNNKISLDKSYNYTYIIGMYIATIPNRTSPPAILLREGYREGGKVKTRTLANITHWPTEKIEAFRQLLQGTRMIPASSVFTIQRSLPHGHVAAVLGTLRRIGLDRIIASRRTYYRDLVIAMIVARIIDPCSKLATARGLGEETAFTTLGETLGVESAGEDDLYEAMDWLLMRQPVIEVKLAKRHLHEGTLVLYDVTSTYFEGRKCPLAKLGHNRDGKKNKLQIVFGLLCNIDGCPVAVEVFDGNTGDPSTLAPQIQKLRKRFCLKRVVMVGDRGMLTDTRIREELEPVDGLDWITALRGSTLKQLVESGVLQLSLFDEQDMAEITSDQYPGERLIVCKNPFLAEDRTRKREELLQATENELNKIVEATQRAKRRLKGADKIGLRVGRVLGKFKMAKHFRIKITDDSFQYERDTVRIAQEAALDGIYIIRTSLPAETMNTENTVRAYKNLSVVERAFKSFKTLDLNVRPIHHRLANRVRSHVFICMLAYYVEWHMRKSLAPVLFDDDDKPTADALRSSIVAPAKRSTRAQRKASTKKTDDNMPVHSFQTLLKDLATITKNRIKPKMEEAIPFEQITQPTSLQQKILHLLEVHL